MRHSVDHSSRKPLSTIALRRGTTRWIVGASALFAALLAVPLVAASGLPPSPVAAGGGVTAGVQPAVNSTCPTTLTISPDSLLIPLAPPSGTAAKLHVGDTFGADYEYQATKLPSGHATSFYVPSASAKFQTSSSTGVSFFFIHRTFSLSASGWSKPVSQSKVLAANLTFSTTNADLSALPLAVMANASYGTAQIEFQWQWWYKLSGSTTVQYGPWSKQYTTGNNTEQPTIFYPAPLVSVVSVSGTTNQIPGTNYTVELKGNVSGTSFRMVVESTSGKELNTVCHTTPTGAKTYNDSIALTYSNGTLLPGGTYIVHVHNAGRAVVVVEKVSVL
jgi:hypothetical protein